MESGTHAVHFRFDSGRRCDCIGSCHAVLSGHWGGREVHGHLLPSLYSPLGEPPVVHHTARGYLDKLGAGTRGEAGLLQRPVHAGVTLQGSEHGQTHSSIVLPVCHHKLLFFRAQHVCATRLWFCVAHLVVPAPPPHRRKFHVQTCACAYQHANTRYVFAAVHERAQLCVDPHRRKANEQPKQETGKAGSSARWETHRKVRGSGI